MITSKKPTQLKRDNSNHHQIPGPHGLSIIGDLLEFSRKPLEFSTRCAHEYGDAVSLSFGPIRIYLFNHPSVIEDVLSKQNQNFIKDISYRVLKGLFGEGLLLSEGELWKRHRRLMQSAFNHEHLADYASAIVADTAQMLARWRSGEIRDVHQEMSQLTRLYRK